MNRPPSAVNVQRQAQAYVPDNRHVIQTAAQIGSAIRGGLDKRRASALKDDLLGATPAQKQSQILGEQVNLQEEQQMMKVRQQAEQNRANLRQHSRWDQIMSSPELKSQLLELQKLDPQTASGLAQILVGDDERQKAAVVQQAAEANRFFVNVAQMSADGLPQQEINSYIKAHAAQLLQSGVEPQKLSSMLSMNPDERIGYAKNQAYIAGLAYKAAEPMTAYQRAQDENADLDRAQRERRFGLDQRKQDFDEQQANAEALPEFGDVQSLRKEFNNETKQFVEQNEAYSRVLASAEDPSAAGDLALVFNYMKVLDPGSTVREGEFANAQNAAGVSGRIRARYNSIVDGKGLSEDQRADFVTRAGKLFAPAKQRYDQLSKEYERLAEKSGMDASDVVVDRMVENPMTQSDQDLFNKYGL